MPTPCEIATDHITIVNYGTVTSAIFEEVWELQCSCGWGPITHRLGSVNRAEWRRHAGMSERRMVNDATVLSK